MTIEPTVLAFETSCDETAVAVVHGSKILSNVLSSQVDLHARFGGVVPEIAARAHVESIRSLTHRALVEAGIHPDDLDGIAATQGPGLVGALLVGFSFAKATAWARQLPFVGVDHMEGHLMAPRLEFEAFAPPAVVLLASGGHSQVVHVHDWGEYEVLGQTIDDAAGEAFDKIARFMGLGYPGGPAIDRISENGDPQAVVLPRALRDRRYDVSFSGLRPRPLLSSKRPKHPVLSRLSRTLRHPFRRRLSMCSSRRHSTPSRTPGFEGSGREVAFSPIGASGKGWRKRPPSEGSTCSCRI